MSRIHLKYPLIVEGKYDKITLSSLVASPIICTGGFSVFRSSELRGLLLRLASASPLLVLVDSDGGGKQIRSFLSSFLPKDRLIQLYIPQITGKEKRKRTAAKAGFLGVEGMQASLLHALLAPFAADAQAAAKGDKITKADFYEDGLSGAADSAVKRARLALLYGLPEDMTANALLESLNLLTDREEYRHRVGEL